MKFDPTIESLNFKTNQTIEIQLEGTEGVVRVEYKFLDSSSQNSNAVNSGLSTNWQTATMNGRKVIVQTPSIDLSFATLQIRLITIDQSYVISSPLLEIDGTPPQAPVVSLASLALTSSSVFRAQVTSCADTQKIYLSAASATPTGNEPSWENCQVNLLQQQNIAGDGFHRFYFWANDKAGNISSQSTYLQVELDTTAPAVSSSSFVAAEILAGGASKNLTWSASDLHLATLPISIELSANDGATWSSLLPLSGNTGLYAWLVPNIDSDLMRVRIRATDLLGHFSESISDRFSVDSTAPVITLNYPNGGEVLKAGALQTVSWTSTDLHLAASSTVLEYSLNGGTNWTTIASQLPASGTYSWTLPNTDSQQVLVRATGSDLVGHTATDVSNAVFTIDQTPAVLSLTNLNGGEVLAAGQSYSITWTLTDNFGLTAQPLTLEYSTNSGSTWSVIASGVTNTGSHSWVAPVVDTDVALLRLTASDLAGHSSVVTSAGYFSIDNSPPVITVSHPLGAELFAGSSVQNIAWSTAGDHLVSSSMLIEFSNGSSWSTVASSQNTTGNFSWTVPALDTTQARLRFTVSDLAGHVVSKTLASSFEIDSAAPSLTVMAPSSGSTYKGGSLLNILWSASDANLKASPIFIQYSVNNGSTWTDLTTAHANSGSYAWTLPVTDTTTAQVRMSATDQVNHITSQTVANFAIDSTAPASLSISGLVAGPTSSTALRTVTVGGSSVSHYKGFLKFGSSCVGELAQVQALTEKTVATADSVSLSSGDGNYIYCALGRDIVGNEQTFVTSSPIIVLDTIAPALAVSSPALNTKAKTKVYLEGPCETGLTVSVSGTGVLSPINLTCTAGSFASDIFFSAGDGVKTITVRQVDAALNVTQVSRDFIRDNVAPVVTQTALSNPYYTNTNAVTWGGSCEANLPLSLTLSGGDSANFNCSNGAWSYTTNTQTTDNSRTYVLTHTDEAGNSSSINMVWVRDTVNPLLVFTTPSTITNTQNNATFQGQCDGAGPITVSGAQVTSVNCTAGNWTFTSAAFVVDGTYEFHFQVMDQAGNKTEIVGTWVRDTSAPALSITGATQKLDTQDHVTFAGACQSDIADVFVTQPVSATLACTAGVWSYTYNNTSDGDYNFSFYQQNTLGTRTTVAALWTRDTTAPVFQDGFFNINTGAVQTTLRYVKVDLKVIDAGSRVNSLCLKADDNSKPSADDGCWNSAFTAAKILILNQIDMGLGLADKNYALYAWAKDEAGNISDLTNGGSGTASKDTKSILLNAGLPPLLSVVAAGVNAPQAPPLVSEQVVTAGAAVYINWKASDDRVLPAQYMTLEFTTDNSGNYDEIATNLGSQAYNSCTIQPGYSGCYKWTSPTNGYLKIRGKVTDSDQQLAFGFSSPLNIGQLRLLAGKTDPGTNQSALVNKFQPYITDYNLPDAFSFVVTRDGVIYVRDNRRGILKIDPVDGIARVFLPKTGSSSGDNGPVTQATANHPTRLLLDKSQPKQKLYIYDYDRIRVVDLNTNIISRVIGGGNQHASGVIATDLAIRPQDPWSSWAPVTMGLSTFMVMPNGDIFFQEAQHRMARKNVDYGQAADDSSALWWYKKSDNRVYKYLASGTGVFLDNLSTPQVYRASQDISKCVQLTYWPDIQADGSFNRIGMVTHTTSEENLDQYTLDCRVSGRERGRWQDTPHFADLNGVKIDDYWSGSDLWIDGTNYKLYHHQQPVLGLDNKIYIINSHESSMGQGLHQYNRATKNFTRIVGSGYRGRCADGTQALSCGDYFQSAFINETGQIYFMTRGLIRTIKADGTVVTVAGTTSADSNGPALDNFLGQVLHFHVRNNGLIMYADQSDYQFREIDPAKTIKTITDGAFGWAHNSGARFAMDPVTGDFYHHNGTWQVAKYTRNSSAFGASGSWSSWIPGNGAYGWDDPAAEGSSDIDFIANGSSNTGPGGAWTGWGAWIPPYPLLFDGQNLLVWISKYALRTDVNGGIINWNTPYRSSLLSFDVNTKSMHRLAGRLDAVGYDVMETGAAANQLQILASEWGHRMLGPYFDPTSSPRRYFTSRPEWNDVYEITDGGGTRVLTTTANRIHAIAYRKISGDDIIYYCGLDTGQVYRRNVTTGIETTLSTNVPNMKCSGYGMQWSDFSQSITFAYEIDGYNGIAEIVDP